MSRLALVAFLLLQLERPAAQIRPGAPPAGKTEDQYGSPRPANLQSIAFQEGARHGDHVRTTGRLEPLTQGGYFALTEAGARVLLILAQGLDPGSIQPLIGARIEVRGVVRPLRPKQYQGGVDVDLIEDPWLPPLPAPSPDLPRVSLTVLGLLDAERRAPGAEGPVASGALARLLGDPSAAGGKPVTVVAQFRGRNLFDDLPKGSERSASDWVVKDESGAAWVVGAAPRGKGFSLDPSYRSDTERWLEIVAKPEVVNGVLYLRASKVKLASAPKAKGESQ